MSNLWKNNNESQYPVLPVAGIYDYGFRLYPAFSIMLFKQTVGDYVFSQRNYLCKVLRVSLLLKPDGLTTSGWFSLSNHK